MHRIKCILLLWIVVGFAGLSCNESNNDFEFHIIAQPQRGHVPLDLAFSLDRSDALSLTDCLADWDFDDGVKLSGLLDPVHTYQEPGQYQVSVNLRCGARESRARTQIELYPSVDLALDALEVRPRDINTGAKLSLGVQLSNLGAELRIASSLAFYLSDSPDLAQFKPSEANHIFTTPIESMPGAGNEGASINLQFEPTLSNTVRTGQYYVVAMLDPLQGLGDSDRSNNALISEFSITVRNHATDGADLKAISLEIEPSKTRQLTALTADFVLKNEGSATAMSFEYALWLGKRDEAQDYTSGSLLSTGSIDGIGSGAMQNFNDVSLAVNPAITEPGLYYVWLVVDSAQSLVERDETNNVVRSSAPIEITDEPILDADIVVTALDFEPKSSVVQGSITAQARIFNQGSQPTGSFVCTLYLSSNQSLVPDKDTVLGSINLYDLAPNESQDKSVLLEIPAGLANGEYWVFAYCDSSGVVAEASENNNVQRSSERLHLVSEANVDLSVASLVLTGSSTIADGSELKLTARLCNMGKTGAGPHILTATATNLCNNNRREVLRYQVDGIEAESCTEAVLSMELHCDFWCEDYRVQFNIDATNVLAEISESNNERILPSGVRIQGANCACEPDSYETNQNSSSAKVLAPGQHALSLCPNDEDWYEIPLSKGQSFELVLDHEEARGALSVSLWSGTQKMAQDALSNKLFLSQFNVNTPQSFLVQVRSTDTKGNLYTLNLNQYNASPSFDLAISDLRIQGDELDIAQERQVSFKLHNLGQSIDRDVRLSLYLSQTETLAPGSEALFSRVYHGLSTALQDDFAKLKLPLDTGSGTWRLIAKVDVDNVIEESNETNNIARSAPWLVERSCWDALDPNDTFESAKDLELSGNDNLAFIAQHLRVCQDNADFYRIQIPTGHALSIQTTNATSGDFDLFLYDAYHNEIASSRTASRNERIELPIVLGSQPVVLEVRQLQNAYNSAESQYSLEISASKVPDWQKCNDAFEPNNFVSAAYSLLSAVIGGGSAALCPATDVDFYTTELSAGQRLQLGFQTQQKTLRAALYSPGGSFAALLTDLTQQSFDYTAPFDGSYLIKIYSNTAQIYQQDYQLKLSGVQGPDLGVTALSVVPQNPSASEVLQVSFSLTNTGSAEITQLKYHVELVQGSRRRTLLQKDLNTNIAAGKSIAISEKCDLPTDIVGSAVIQVSTELMQGTDIFTPNNSVSLPLTIQQACQPDPLEDNNTPTRASALSLSPITANICQNDEDWFQFVASQTRVYTASLSFTHALGDLDLYIFDEDLQEIAQSRSQNDKETASFSAINAAKYYILVKPFQLSSPNTYQLMVQ